MKKRLPYITADLEIIDLPQNDIITDSSSTLFDPFTFETEIDRPISRNP
jgi:hypothetical protein